MGKLSWLIPSRAPPEEGGARGALRGGSDDASDLAKRYKITSMVGEGMVVGGPVLVRDSLMVFGQLRAGVRLTGESSVLLLREGSLVHGDVVAAVVLVKGNVRGNITGKTVRLYAGCKVLGQIRAENLIVDEGATIYNRSVQANSKGLDPNEAAAAQSQESAQPAAALTKAGASTGATALPPPKAPARSPA